MPNSTLNSEHTKNKGIFALFKGLPGTGKSDAALSFPTPYVFDFDRKMPAIAMKHFPGKDVHWDNFENIFHLRDRMNELIINCPYETLIFDSVTSLSSCFLNSMDRTKGTSLMEQISRAVTTKTGEKMIEAIGIDYYNAESSFFERFIIEMSSLLYAREKNPKHVIILAHVLVTESAPNPLKQGATTISRSILTAGRKAATAIEKSFDETYYFTVESNPFSANTEPTYICNTKPAGADNARTAFNLPARINFTNKNFYDLIKKDCNFE